MNVLANVWAAIFILSGILLIAFLIGVTIQDQKDWVAFRKAHHCKVIGEMESSTSIGVGPIISDKGGVAIVTETTPAKEGWLCDDGVTYWRNK